VLEDRIIAALGTMKGDKILISVLYNTKKETLEFFII